MTYFTDHKHLSKTIICFAAVWILIAGLCSSLYAAEDTIRLHFIDVGYGDAILIELSDGRNILIDAGEQQYVDRLTGYFSSLQIRNFDTVILTHPHKNHFEGFLSLVGKWPIGKFYTNGDTLRAEEGYDDLLLKIKEAGIPLVILREGDELPFEGMDFRISVLHPSFLDGSANENVLVLWVEYEETSFLLTSDIQVPQQERIVEYYNQIKSANVVQVPHHGGSIADQFADSFGSDSVFVVSTGTNDYEKPFVKELDKLKGKILRTDVHGTVVVQSDGHEVKIINE